MTGIYDKMMNRAETLNHRFNTKQYDFKEFTEKYDELLQCCFVMWTADIISDKMENRIFNALLDKREKTIHEYLGI